MLRESAKLFAVIRKISIAIWLSIALGGVVAFSVWPQTFTPDSIAALLTKFQSEALLIYLLISILRGFTLLPSTPFVIAGTLLFPRQPWLVFGVSLIGIVAASSMIYWLSDYLGIAEFFESRKPTQVAKIRARVEHPAGILFVVLWAFFPVVPTDAVCYVAGSIRMNFVKFIAAIFVGEVILCSIYVFGGSQLMTQA